jgi:hypothetical protein
MALQFRRAVENMEIWSASSEGFSFVISYGSPTGPGFHGRPGYLASWRPLHQSRGAIKIGGSPFKTFAEAEEASNLILKHLTQQNWRACGCGAARRSLPVCNNRIGEDAEPELPEDFVIKKRVRRFSSAAWVWHQNPIDERKREHPDPHRQRNTERRRVV